MDNIIRYARAEMALIKLEILRKEGDLLEARIAKHKREEDC